jgi:hypothetical protein
MRISHILSANKLANECSAGSSGCALPAKGASSMKRTDVSLVRNLTRITATSDTFRP